LQEAYRKHLIEFGHSLTKQAAPNPVKAASEAVGKQIASAMDSAKGGEVVHFAKPLSGQRKS
jgi:hypothetical protein